MHRAAIIQLLNDFSPLLPEEQAFKSRIIAFIENEPDCFKRGHLAGHITGSAFIVNETYTKTALVLHAKINKWLQPGGHADGDSDIMRVALKEAEEETGLTQLKVVKQIFDIDIHTIAERKAVPVHLHYDIRFLIMANEAEPFLISDESADIQWIDLAEMANYNNEASIARMVEKVQKLRNLL
jgi:8-oxo-dGTP pyrophosphatase MutT (NUDIX family)